MSHVVLRGEYPSYRLWVDGKDISQFVNAFSITFDAVDRVPTVKLTVVAKDIEVDLAGAEVERAGESE